MSELKLIALDREDLAVLSAQLQDAVVRVQDMAFVKPQSRFALIANRFDWLTAMKRGDRSGSRGKPYERKRAALRFERVERVQLQGFELDDKRRVLALLAIAFSPARDEGPDGCIDLIFSGGASLRLHVECIEAELRDLGAAWATRSKPKHPIGLTDDEGGEGGQ